MWVQSLVGELRSSMPHGQKPKYETEAILKSLKMVHIKKKNIFKEKDALVIQSFTFGFNHHSDFIIK